MERKRKIIAALADLKQEIAGVVPVDIISKWSSSSRTAAIQQKILQPLERHGYLVSSDSAGLSKITAEKTLLEVMELVSKPKEIIFTLGKSIGGRGVGIWAADNTQMFYDEKIPAIEVIEAMSAAQKHIQQGVLQVGIAIHKGVFWEIGQGMFGQEADLLEEIAENETSAREIVISGNVRKLLHQKNHSKLVLREDIERDLAFYRVNYDSYGHSLLNKITEIDLQDQGSFYPLPFSTDFYIALKQMRISGQTRKQLDKYFLTKTVVLIKIYHQKNALLLNQLMDWVVINALLNQIAEKYSVQTVKSNGDLGIFVADDQAEAVEFAENLLLSMRETKDLVSIGVAAGEVLLFELDQGGMDISGGPVNIASKISEDIPEQNTLYIEETVKIPAHHDNKFREFTIERSGVVLKGKSYIK